MLLRQVALRARTFMVIALIAISASTVATNILAESTTYAAGCSDSGSFFGLPHWYDNLPLQPSQNGQSCSIVLSKPEQVWIIVLNVINILLRLTGIVAVVFIIVGGIRYITSQGASAGITAAKQTIVRAIAGLILSILAVLLVTFVAARFGQTLNPDNYLNSNSYSVYNVTEGNYV